MRDPSGARALFSPLAARRLRVGLVLATGMVVLLSLLGAILGQSTASPWVPAVRSPLAAALLLALLAALLGMETWPGSALVRNLTCGLAAVVALVSLGFALGQVPGNTPTFERWLLQGRPFQLASVWTDVALLGAALSFLARWLPAEATWGTRQTATLLALVPLLIGTLLLLGFAVGAPQLYGYSNSPMSLPAALCSAGLGLALHLVAGCDTWPLAAFQTRSAPGQTWSVFGFSPGLMPPVLLSGVLILAGGSFFVRTQTQDTRAKVEENLRATAAAKTRQIGAWFGERRGDAEQIARSALIQTQLRRFLAGTAAAPPEGDVRAWLEALQQGNYRRAVLYDAQGRPRMAVASNEAPTFGDMDASEVQAALASKDVLIRDLHRHPGGTDLHLGFWVPIGAEAGRKAQGALLLMVDPRQFLFPLVQSWPTASATAETLLVRRAGDQVLFLNDLRHRAQTALTLQLPLAVKSSLPAARAIWGERGLMEGLDYRGVPVLAVAEAIPGTPWHMVAKVDMAEAFGPLRRGVWLGVVGLLGTLALAGAALGLLLHRHDADLIRKQLQLSQQFEGLMRGANDIILLLDGEGHILEANARALESYGYSQGELQSMTVLDLRAPETLGEGKAQLQQVKATGSGRFETTHRRQDGSTFPVEVSSRALQLGGELRLISFARDISERRVQERELLRLTQLYGALSQVNLAIVRTSSQQALFERLCEVMVEFGQCTMAWIGLEDPVSHRVKVAARYGDVHGLLDRFSVRSDDSDEGRGAVGTVIRQGVPYLDNDYLAAAESAPWRADLQRADLLSIAAFPIRREGQVCGALVVYAAEKEFFGAREAELLEEASADVSFALDHLASEERRRKAEAALQENERFLRVAEEAGRIGTYQWDISRNVWTSSPYLDEIFGIDAAYPRTLQGWADLVIPDFREQMQTYVAGIIERHESFDLEYPIIRKANGERRWVRGTGEFQWHKDGRPLALMGVIRDITERRQARAALEASEKKFAQAFRASPDSVNINRLADGVYLDVNDGFTRVTGYTAEEVLGRSSLPGELGIWVHAEDRLRLHEGLRQEGRVSNLEAPFRRKDGTVLTGLMSATTIEVDGEPCVLSIVRDITQLRAQARQLEQITQMYAALSQVNQAIVFSPTREALVDKICEVMVEFGRFSMAWIGWNDPATHEVRVASRYGDANGYLDGLQVRSDDTLMGRGPTGRAIREGVSQVENDFLGNSEADPWHGAAVRCGYGASAAFPIRQDGAVCGALTVYSAEKGFFGAHEVALLEEAAGDVSFALDHLAGEAQRRSLEAQLHQSQKLESLGSLAGGVAHDMNNVLGAVLSLASTLRENAEPLSPAAKNLDTIMSACMRGRSVVKSLLYFAQKDLQEERLINLNDLVKEMVQLLRHTTLQRMDLQLQLQEDLGLIRGDAGALSHALMNLCVNAIDAMPGGGALRIETASGPDGAVILRVRDEGEGMAPEVLAKAMEPFFTTKAKGKGTGLGLAMVYGTMKAHDGRFDLHSQPGQGTEAVLRFPASRVEGPAQVPAQPPPVVAGPPQAELKILLVDDDDLIRESVSPMLEMLGHQVTGVPGGAQALALLEEGLGVDLVILDMNMPGMSGAQALPRILDLRPGLHVLVATGYSEEEVAPLMNNRPSVSSLRKPFSLKEIQSKLAALRIQPGSDLRA
jgi:PAS domain S-box-containing protein